MATRKKAAGTTPPAAPAPPSRPAAALPQSNPQDKPFTPEVLDRSVIATPLQDMLKSEDEALRNNPTTPRRMFHVIIDLHLEYPGGRPAARKRVEELLKAIFRDDPGLPHPAAPGLGLSDPSRVGAVPVRRDGRTGDPRTGAARSSPTTRPGPARDAPGAPPSTASGPISRSRRCCTSR